LEKHAKIAEAASTQNTIRYTSLFSDGIMHVVDNTWSKTFSLGMTNYLTATEEDKKNIISRYNDTINTLSENEHFQLTLHIRKIEAETYKQETAYELQGDSMDIYRNELNHIIEENYARGLNNYQVDRYITISTQADNRLKATSKFDNIATLMSSDLSNIDVSFEALSGEERLNLLNSILRPHTPVYGRFEDIAVSNLTTKDFIAPESLKFNKSDFEINSHLFGKILYLRDFPTELSDGLFKELTETNQELVITIHAQPYSIVETNRRLRNQATSVEGELVKQQMRASQNGYSAEFVARSAKEAQADLDEVINFVRETGDKQFSSIFLVYVMAESSEKLKENTAIIRSVGDKYGAVFSDLDFIQEEALNSVLPIGKNYTDAERTFQRDLITPNIAVNSPFTSVDIHHKNGKYYGINLLSNNTISINRRDPSLDNSNGLITGVSGSGKSMNAKHEIISTLLKEPKSEVIIVSPENEYDSIAEKLGGQVVRVAPKSPTRINIMDLPDRQFLAADDDPVALKSDFLVSLFASIFPTLTEVQESIIDEITIKAYENTGKTTLVQWYQLLADKANKEQNEQAADLAQKLAMYVTGSLDMFAGETNVNLTNRFVVYNINQLKNKFKPFGFMAVEDKVWQGVVENFAKGVRTWVYFDEIQVLLSGSSSELTREKFQDIWARIRKYGGNPTGITQSIETVLATQEGRAMFFNSEFLILLKQKAEVFDLLVKTLRLTNQQSRFLKNPPKGAGLIVAGNTIVPFSNTIPQNTKLYEIMATDS
jgi:hypothetical protein